MFRFTFARDLIVSWMISSGGVLVGWFWGELLKLKFEKSEVNEVHSSTKRCREGRRRSSAWRFDAERLAASSRSGTASRSWKRAVRWRVEGWTKARTWSSAPRRWCTAWIAAGRKERARQCVRWGWRASRCRPSGPTPSPACCCCAESLLCSRPAGLRNKSAPSWCCRSATCMRRSPRWVRRWWGLSDRPARCTSVRYRRCTETMTTGRRNRPALSAPSGPVTAPPAGWSRCTRACTESLLTTPPEMKAECQSAGWNHRL